MRITPMDLLTFVTGRLSPEVVNVDYHSQHRSKADEAV